MALVLTQSGHSSFLFHSYLHLELWAASPTDVGVAQMMHSNPLHSLPKHWVCVFTNEHKYNLHFLKGGSRKVCSGPRSGFELFDQRILASLLPRGSLVGVMGSRGVFPGCPTDSYGLSAWWEGEQVEEGQSGVLCNPGPGASILSLPESKGNSASDHPIITHDSLSSFLYSLLDFRSPTGRDLPWTFLHHWFLAQYLASIRYL